MSELVINPAETALVLIDLQHGIVSRPTEPRSGDEVVHNAVRLLTVMRAAGSTVALVRVGFPADGKGRPSSAVDRPMMPASFPSDWLEFAPGINPLESDLLILKRQWGAVYGTELDPQLRRRGVRTVVLGGIATNIGVESTARDLWERGYDLVFAEDAMASRSAEMHRFAVEQIFPLIGRVRSTAAICQSLSV